MPKNARVSTHPASAQCHTPRTPWYQLPHPHPSDEAWKSHRSPLTAHGSHRPTVPMKHRGLSGPFSASSRPGQSSKSNMAAWKPPGYGPCFLCLQACLFYPTSCPGPAQHPRRAPRKHHLPCPRPHWPLRLHPSSQSAGGQAWALARALCTQSRANTHAPPKSQLPPSPAQPSERAVGRGEGRGAEATWAEPGLAATPWLTS